MPKKVTAHGQKTRRLKMPNVGWRGAWQVVVSPGTDNNSGERLGDRYTWHRDKYELSANEVVDVGACIITADFKPVPKGLALLVSSWAYYTGDHDAPAAPKFQIYNYDTPGWVDIASMVLSAGGTGYEYVEGVVSADDNLYEADTDNVRVRLFHPAVAGDITHEIHVGMIRLANYALVSGDEPNDFDIVNGKGKVISGALKNITEDDDHKLILGEVVGAPGFEYMFEYGSGGGGNPVPPDGNKKVKVKGNYVGTAEDKKISVYDFDSEGYVDMTAAADDFPSSDTEQEYSWAVPKPRADKVEDGVMRVKLTKDGAGVVSNRFNINQMVLEDGTTTTTSTTTTETTTTTTTTVAPGVGTDFSEYDVGVDLSDWSDIWAQGQLDYTAQNNGGGDFVAGSKYLKFWRSGGDARSGLTWDDISGEADVDIVALFRHNIASLGVNFMAVSARVGGSGGSENAYMLIVEAANIKLHKYVGGVSTGIATIPSTLYGAANGWIWTRFRVNGENLYGKVWAVNEVEPDDWTITGSDAELESGTVGLGQHFWLTRMDVEYFECATGGGAPTFPPAGWVGDDKFGPLIMSTSTQLYMNSAIAMGGTFTGAGRFLRGIGLYCTDHSDDVRVAVYSGGTLANGPGSSGDEATLLRDFGLTSGAGVNAWITMWDDAVAIPDGEPLWIVVKGDNAAGFEVIYEANNMGLSADYQTARGRALVTGQVGSDPDVAFAGTFPTGNATFADDVYGFEIYLDGHPDIP